MAVSSGDQPRRSRGVAVVEDSTTVGSIEDSTTVGRDGVDDIGGVFVSGEAGVREDVFGEAAVGEDVFGEAGVAAEDEDGGASPPSLSPDDEGTTICEGLAGGAVSWKGATWGGKNDDVFKTP